MESVVLSVSSNSTTRNSKQKTNSGLVTHFLGSALAIAINTIRHMLNTLATLGWIILLVLLLDAFLNHARLITWILAG